MAITYPLSFPAVTSIGGSSTITGKDITLIANFIVAKSKSPYTGQMQGYIHQGAWWSVKVDMPQLTRAQAEPFIAFLMALWGKSGTFLFGPQDPAGKAVLGTAGGSPVVNGANASGSRTLAIRSLTGVLKAGDYISVGSGLTTRLYKNLTDQGPGTVTLDIFPPLREALADGAAIALTNCKGLFELDNNQVPYSVGTDGTYSISFSATESI
jgi:hypothetical protein